MRPSRLRLLAGGAIPVVLAGAGLALVPARSPADRAASISLRIERAQGQIERKRGGERVLASDIAGFNSRIGALQGDITNLERREAVIQADLNRKRDRLARTQQDLRTERARLARLKAELAADRIVLARRLREIYTADRPDIVTVILNAHGFADLLERGEFMHRINEQDARIVERVKLTKARTAAATRRLAVLEARQRRITAQMQARRDEVAQVRSQLQAKRDRYAAVRAERQSALTETRQERRAAQEDLASLEAEQARIQSELSGFGSGAAGPVRRGSGRFIWPVNGPITGVFGEWRGDHVHEGVDIEAGEGTPIRAAGSGTVRIAGWYGGYGNYTCIQHGGSLSTCYGHQSAIGVGVGQRVSQGQVIGAVGKTGHSFGAHLHFEVRINGVAIDPMGYL